MDCLMSQKLLEDLSPGMVLALEVRSPEGRLLLPAGTLLVPYHLKFLRQWKITVVAVQSPNDNATTTCASNTEPPDPAAHTRHERHLNDLFRLVDRSDPVMDAFHRFLLDRLDRSDSMTGGGL